MQEGTPIIIKKVKKHGHGHHGGAWKVAYADFVTAMMAFFMVLWILGMSPDQQKEIAEYFNNPMPWGQGTPKMKPMILKPSSPMPSGSGKSSSNAPTRNMGQEIQKGALERVKEQVQEKMQKDPELSKLVQSGFVSMAMTSEGLKIELIENQADGEVFFISGSAEIRPRAREVFARIAPVLTSSKRFLYVDGHTDSHPMNGPLDNYDLSTQRANAVRRVLMSSGLPESQVLEVRGKADKEPRLPEDPFHFSNRRVTVLLPFRYAKQPTMELPAAPETEDQSALIRDRGVFGGADKVKPNLEDLRDKVTDR